METISVGNLPIHPIVAVREPLRFGDVNRARPAGFPPCFPPNIPPTRPIGFVCHRVKVECRFPFHLLHMAWRIHCQTRRKDRRAWYPQISPCLRATPAEQCNRCQSVDSGICTGRGFRSCRLQSNPLLVPIPSIGNIVIGLG